MLIHFAATLLAQQVAEQTMSANPLVTVLAFLLMLGILVIVHELGHFVTGLWMGVKVEEFGIGYPPRALTLFERNGIKYTLNWLPLGGFVRFGGEENTLYGVGSLAAAAPWRKILVMVAGPLMNLLLTIAIFVVFAATIGLQTPTGTQRVALVYANTPAAKAGLLVGDEIVSFHGLSVAQAGRVGEIASAADGVTIPMVIRRDGAELTIQVTPGPWTTPDGEQRSAGVGISYSPERRTLIATNPVEAVVFGTQQTFDLLGQMLRGLPNIPASIGSIFRPNTSPAEDPIGPVGIARVTGEVVQRGGLTAFFSLMAVLSLNLFLLNLLPIPTLEGSHIIFSLV